MRVPATTFRSPRQIRRLAADLTWPRQALFGFGLATAAAVLAFGASRSPVIALVTVAGLVVVAVVARNSLVMVSILTVGFFFQNYLDKGVGLATPIKAIGALALGAWLLEWGLSRRHIVVCRTLLAVLALDLWVMISFTLKTHQQAAVTSVVQYVDFSLLFFLVVQVLGGDDRRARIVAGVTTVASGTAAVVGLVVFLGQGVRAVGPVGDPNDFAFVLASNVPLALYETRWATSPWARRLSGLAVAVILATILATYSRSGLVALLGAGMWAMATRRISVRATVATVASGALVVLALFLTQPQVISHVLQAKSAVAQQNVNDRYYLWGVALKEFSANPITGVGPGNYEPRFYDFAPPILGTKAQPLTTHNAYLNVLAELGAPGTALFLLYLGLSWIDLRRRFPLDPQADALQGALAAGFVAALVGAFFLTEQYLAPFWLLPAIGASQALRLSQGQGRPSPAITQAPR